MVIFFTGADDRAGEIRFIDAIRIVMRFQTHTTHVMIRRVRFTLPVIDMVAGVKLNCFHVGISGHGNAGLVTRKDREFLEFTGGTEDEVVVVSQNKEFLKLQQKNE